MAIIVKIRCLKGDINGFREKEIESAHFVAKTNEGKEYTVIEYQELLLTHSSNEKDAGALGQKKYKISTVVPVTKIDSKGFKNNLTGEIIFKV